MRLGWFDSLRSSFYAFLLHLIAVSLLIFSFDFAPKIHRPRPEINIVNAVSVDQTQVEQELKRIKQAEEEKLVKEREKLKELEKQAEAEKKKAEDSRKQRLKEEQELIAAKKKKELEQEKRELEQKKLDQLEKEKTELERQRKIEEEKKKKVEEENKRLVEEKRKAEEEKKQKEAEKTLQEQLAKELADEEARSQAENDKKLVSSLGNEINDKITRYFNLTGIPEGLSCKLRVQLLPNGDVINASIIQSSGNDIFDRRARIAVEKASPLPVPDDLKTFERLNLRDLTINFKP